MKILGPLFIGFVVLILTVGTFRLLSQGERPDPVPLGVEPANTPRDQSFSKYKKCDRYPPGTAARIFCEDMERERAKQAEWENYRKTHPRK